MKSTFVTGYFLLISALLFCVDAQLSGTLVVDVEAKTDSIEVFWSIFNGANSGVNITYEICYGLNVNNPSNFKCNTTGAKSEDAENRNNMTLPNIPSATDVTVVVVARSNNGNLTSLSPVTRRTLGDQLAAPMSPGISRFDDNKTLAVSWLPVTFTRTISYEIEYRAYIAGVLESDLISTFLPVTGVAVAGGRLAHNITGVDGDTNYQARVRARTETPNKDDFKSITTTPGPWSEWEISQVKIDTGGLTGSASVTAIFCNGIIITTLLFISVFIF